MTASRQLIGNRFEIADPERDLLGRGGTGAVYRGRDTRTGESVAIKVLDPARVAGDPNALARFLREGEALRQLNHPNIVQMIAAFGEADGLQENGRHYLVMEYVPGGSLRDLLEQEGRLSIRRTVEMALDVADALTRAHRLGIVHRDLKPSNVLLAEDSTPRLADFGHAQLAASSRLTQTGTVVGTVLYLSPEACRGEQLDARADIWAFGVMLYEMLTAQVPFPGETFPAVFSAILSQPVPDVQRAAASQACPDVPDALADLVYRMLEKERRQRIPSMRLVGAELETVQSMVSGQRSAASGQPALASSRFTFTAPAGRLEHNLPLQPDLHIQLLGRFRVCVGSRQIEDAAWRLRKAAAIVKLLALAPQHRLHREQLMDVLWPDFEPQAAANNLRHTLHVARRILDPPPPDGRPPPSPYLQGDPLELCPAGRVWVDVQAFEAAAAAARQDQDPAAYQATLGLYTGDLLPEDRYEEWANHRRDELRGLFLSLLSELARLQDTEGDLARAIETLQRVVVHDPTHEDAHAHLMRLYIRSGQRYQALQQYRQLEATLANELDAEPGPTLQQFYEELVDHRFSFPTPSSPTPPPPIRRHNLPAPVTTFVGREREMGEVQRLLERTRLLTLTGPGGCGKTRLAIEVASRLGETYPDGVWLIELAAVEDTDLVSKALAAALGIAEQPGRPLRETLCTALEGKHLLLVLDNCEHLVEACAILTDDLLHACPHLRVLATTRQALGIAGEQVWRVPSLELPDIRGKASLDEIARSEAVRLFLNRAQLSRSGFVLTEGNAAPLVEVCRHLDGMPLAIELAAARLRVLSVEQIAAHLDERFALLTGGSRAALPRQRTLRAMVDWSYDLLSEAERTLFDRLSVFSGGWSLEAATETCTGSGISAGQILTLLSSLVDQSLVVVEVGDAGTACYRLLETLRQYAQQRLAERSEVAPVTCRHAAHYLALAEAAEPELTGPQQVTWLDHLEREHDNLRAALRWSLESGQAETAARLSGALGLFWFVRGHLSEGIRWLDAALCARGTLSLPLCAKMLMWAGGLRLEQGDYVRGQVEAEESLSIWHTLGDRHWTAINLNVLGCTLRERGNLERAMELLEQGLQMARKTGDSNLIGLSLTNLGDVARYQGDYARAAPMYSESLVLFRETGDLRRAAFSLTNLAYIANQQGDPEQALALYLQGLEQAQGVGDRHRLAVCLEGLAEVALGWGQTAAAARLLGAAEALRDALGAPLSVVQRTVYEHFAEVVGGATEAQGLGAACRTAWDAGREMTLEQAIDYAQTVRLSRPSTTRPAGSRRPGEWPSEGQAASLTAREIEVAALVARGLTNREIAQTLVIAEGTAANHVHHILAKLGLASRQEIAAWATTNGLYREPRPSIGPPA